MADPARAPGHRATELPPSPDSRRTRSGADPSRPSRSRPVGEVAYVDAAHQVEIPLLVMLREFAVPRGLDVVGLETQGFLEVLRRLQVEAVLQLRDPLVEVGAEKVGARVLVLVVLLVDPPKDRDGGVVLAF